jgi:hypothetical protein
LFWIKLTHNDSLARAFWIPEAVDDRWKTFRGAIGRQ